MIGNLAEILGGSNLLLLLLIFWRVSRASGKIEQVMRDYPPHRHVNGSIMYPHGFEPGEIVPMGGKGAH